MKKCSLTSLMAINQRVNSSDNKPVIPPKEDNKTDESDSKTADNTPVQTTTPETPENNNEVKA